MRLERVLDSGKGLDRFHEMVAAQGGDLQRMRSRAPEFVIVAEHEGFVGRVDAERLGQLVIDLGGGRHRVGDPIDHSVGIEWLVRIGEPIERQTPVTRVFARTDQHEYAASEILASITLDDLASDAPPLIVC